MFTLDLNKLKFNLFVLFNINKLNNTYNVSL